MIGLYQEAHALQALRHFFDLHPETTLLQLLLHTLHSVRKLPDIMPLSGRELQLTGLECLSIDIHVVHGTQGDHCPKQSC